MKLDTLLNDKSSKSIIDDIVLECVISLTLLFYITQGYKIYELVYNIGSVHNISGFQVIISLYNACITSTYYSLKEQSEGLSSLLSFTNISTAMIPAFYCLIFLFHFSKRVIKLYILYLCLLFGSISLLCFGIVKCKNICGDGFMMYLQIFASIVNCLYFFQSLNLKNNFVVANAHKLNIVNAIFGLVHSIGWIIYFILQEEKSEKHILIIYAFGSVISLMYISHYIIAKSRKNSIDSNIIFHSKLYEY